MAVILYLKKLINNGGMVVRVLILCFYETVEKRGSLARDILMQDFRFRADHVPGPAQRKTLPSLRVFQFQVNIRYRNIEFLPSRSAHTCKINPKKKGRLFRVSEFSEFQLKRV